MLPLMLLRAAAAAAAAAARAADVESGRGNSITGSRFEKLSSIFGNAHGEPSAVYLNDQLSSVDIRACCSCS